MGTRPPQNSREIVAQAMLTGSDVARLRLARDEAVAAFASCASIASSHRAADITGCDRGATGCASFADAARASFLPPTPNDVEVDHRRAALREHFLALRHDLLACSQSPAVADNDSWEQAAVSASLRASQAGRHAVATGLVAAAFEPDPRDRSRPCDAVQERAWSAQQGGRWEPAGSVEHTRAPTTSDVGARLRRHVGLSEWRMRHAAAFWDPDVPEAPMLQPAQPCTRGDAPVHKDQAGCDDHDASRGLGPGRSGASDPSVELAHCFGSGDYAWDGCAPYGGTARVHEFDGGGGGDGATRGGRCDGGELEAARARLAEAARALNDSTPTVGTPHPRVAERVAAELGEARRKHDRVRKEMAGSRAACAGPRTAEGEPCVHADIAIAGEAWAPHTYPATEPRRRTAVCAAEAEGAHGCVPAGGVDCGSVWSAAAEPWAGSAACPTAPRWAGAAGRGCCGAHAGGQRAAGGGACGVPAEGVSGDLPGCPCAGLSDAASRGSGGDFRGCGGGLHGSMHGGLWHREWEDWPSGSCAAADWSGNPQNAATYEPRMVAKLLRWQGGLAREAWLSGDGFDDPPEADPYGTRVLPEVDRGGARGWYAGGWGIDSQLAAAARRAQRHTSALARSRYGGAFAIPTAPPPPPAYRPVRGGSPASAAARASPSHVSASSASSPAAHAATRPYAGCCLPRSGPDDRGFNSAPRIGAQRGGRGNASSAEARAAPAIGAAAGGAFRAAACSEISQATAMDRLAEAMRALGAPASLRPEVARLLGLHRPSRPTYYKIVVHLRHAEFGLRPGFYSLDGRIEFRLGQTTTIEGERAVGGSGEEGSGGFFVWPSVQTALAATFSPATRLFEAPRALLRVYSGGMARALPVDSRFSALVDERCCFPLVTPVSVVASGQTLLRLYERFLETTGEGQDRHWMGPEPELAVGRANGGNGEDKW